MANGKTQWTPWHKVVSLREDLRSGELSMAVFAADLYEVVMGTGRKVYTDPREFFALTYPTTNLRDLAKDVVLRLAGKSTKAIRQLELTYGGGKTHTLITLFHLANDPAGLPDLPAVREFREHIGVPPVRARIAVLPFDKLDVEKGMEVRDPKGKVRRLKQPWSVLAWQIAGEDGLKLLHADDKAEERDTAPAQSLLEPLLKMPEKEGLSTLILIDEVLMYAHEKVTHQPEWLGRLKNFFQYLCQAVVKVDRCAMVASLLATEPSKNDELGKKIVQEISDVLAREKEEGVQPVLREDVAEVLRRRFFTPESIADKDRFREHVFAALQGILELDENSKKNKKAVEERFVRSYPFHPDMTEVFYTKWTGLDSFQRTRGVLRTFALALRDSEKWDSSPLVGPNVFLAPPGKDAVSEAARELTGVATKEQTEGGSQANWTAILEGELKKAREIEDEFTSLKHREVEQAVFSTFVHSQPPGAKALLNELIVMIGTTRPDKISLEKGLRTWFDRSWFLDESADAETKPAPGQPRPLPMSWRLGAKPNLRQMHADALTHVPDDLIDARLAEEIRRLKLLTAGASAAGASVHLLPDKPSDIDDDGAFHYAVLGPSAASESGKPSAEARRYLEENTGPNNPRKERNAVVLAVPSRENLFAVRQAIKDYLGWEEVKSSLKGQDLDPVRAGMLSGYTDQAMKKIPGTLAQAYCIVVTVAENDEVQAFKIQVGDKSLFQAIKDDKRARIQDTAISADAILPGGPYDLWRKEEDSRRVKDIAGAFARFPRLPKMLRREAILDTIINGCQEGTFVARVTRADRSVRTLWRTRPEQSVIDDPSFEVVLPEKAELTDIDPPVLAPNVLKDLWKSNEITVSDLQAFFDGTHTVATNRGGYEEQLPVPKAPTAVVDAAIASLVRTGKVWLTSGPASFLDEELPAGVLTPSSILASPPAPIGPTEMLPDRIPDAWKEGQANAMGFCVGLSRKAGKNLPWCTVREAIDGAIRSRLIERTTTSGAWPCEFSSATSAIFKLANSSPPPPPPPNTTPPTPGARTGEAELRPNQVQDLAEIMGDLLKVKAGYELRFRVRVELVGKDAPPDAVVQAMNAVLKGTKSGIEIR